MTIKDKKKYEDMNEEEKEIVKFFGFNEFEYDELNKTENELLLELQKTNDKKKFIKNNNQLKGEK